MSDHTPPLPPRRRWSRFIPLILIAALLGLLLASGELKRLSLVDIAAHRAQLAHLVILHPIASLAAYVGVFVLLIVACVPGASVMTIVGGLLFGPWLGGSAALVSEMDGAVIVFLACRTAFGDWAAERAGPTVGRIEAGFSRNAFSYLLALRLMPVAPFPLVTIAAGLARIRLPSFIVATLIGSAPAAFIFAGLGSGFDEAIHRGAKLDASLLMRPAIVLPLTALALMSLAAPAWRLWRSRRG